MTSDEQRDVDDEVVDLEAEEHYDQQGRRITTAEVEAAADALERGDYEVTGVIYPRRGRGRPSLSESGDPSPKIQARVSDVTRSRLSEIARQQHRGTSDVVREALEEYLARH